MKLNPKMRKLLEWLSRGSILESQIAGSGLSKTLNEALLAGWANIAETPVRERGAPAAAYSITDAGRAALSQGDTKP